MASGITPTKRFVVRTSLVTGSTLALIVGAQALVSVDLQNKSAEQSATTQIAESSTVLQTQPLMPPTQAVISAAPNIVILRHPSEAKPITSNNSNQPPIHARPVQPAPSALIQPPQPVVVPAQGPVVIQGSAPSAPAPTTRSTR